jgi:ferredoxin
MIFTEKKPIAEVLGYLKDKNKVFIAGCGTCAKSWHTGGDAEILEMKDILEKEGKTVTGCQEIDVGCDERHVRRELQRRHKDEVAEADAVLIMSCGAGTGTAAANLPDKPVYPTNNTMFLGRLQRLTAADERCILCGECLLAWTGGLCPITLCPKGLLNGPCGGTTKEGKCEVDSSKDCAWVAIFEKMENIGETSKLDFITKPKDYTKGIHPHSENKEAVKS